MEEWQNNQRTLPREQGSTSESVFGKTNPVNLFEKRMLWSNTLGKCCIYNPSFGESQPTLALLKALRSPIVKKQFNLITLQFFYCNILNI